MDLSGHVTATGYSGTPLWKKLGIQEGMAWVALGAPEDYPAWLAPLPAGARITSRAGSSPRAVHLFVTSSSRLAKSLSSWRPRLAADVFLRVSWPKRASKLPTDVTEDVVRELALPLGFVDVKVCAVSAVWSGLKLVIRRELRER